VTDTATDTAKAAIIQTMLSNTQQFRGLLDLQGRFIELNEPALEFLGEPRQVLIGQAIWQGDWWLSQNTRLEVQRQTQQAAVGAFNQAEYEIESRGRRVWIEFLLKPIRNPAGSVVMILAEGNDISERKRHERTLKEREAFYTTMLTAMSEGVLYVSGEREVLFVNPAAEQLLGLSRAELLSGHFRPSWFLVHEDGSPVDRDSAELPSVTALLTGEAQRNFVAGVYKPTGEVSWLLVNHQPLARDDAGLVPGMIITLTDITERKMLEDKLRQAALYDALTGLATRTLLLEHLTQAIAQHKRDSSSEFAVLFIDLNHFKQVNDTLGHQAGDALLVEVAKRLQRTVRESDTVARLGGDEFVVLLTGFSNSDATLLAERLLRELRFEVPGHDGAIEVSGSLGLAFSGSYASAEELLANADKAMYKAKALVKRSL
jgi:diguanylate cyclase (GGDEF)-like protein/PAS domain S-box-containing protein